MVLELIAVIVSGLMGAGVMLILGKITGDRLPRWLMPLGAGAAMLITTISSEYGWYPRTRAALPDGIVVADAVEDSAWWRPWTFAAPMVTRFVAVDTGRLRENGDNEGLYMADLYFFGRWRPVQAVQMLVDCPGGRRADPTRGDGGAPVWRAVGAEDPIVATVCRAV